MIWEFSCPTTTRCYAVGEGQTFFTSDDAALTWTRSWPPVGPTPLIGLSFPTELVGWIVTESGRIARTQNGADFVVQHDTAGVVLRDVDAVSTSEAWAVGDGALLLHTSNGGDSWDPVAAPAGVTAAIATVHFVDSHHGWAGCDDGTLLRYAPSQ